jgi:ubiquinone/menaquinone biosynthesis C-methylase UbiE
MMSNTSHYGRGVASKYDKLRAWSTNVVGRIADRSEISSESRVLDIGCGTGNLMEGVRRICQSRFTGLDLSGEMLRVAIDKVPPASFVQADVAALPFRDGAFDIVMGAYFIHHVPCDFQPAVIAECRRIISGGRLVIITASHNQIEQSQVGRFFPEIIEVDKQRFPTIGQLCDWFRSSGFVDVGHETAMDNPVRLGHDYLNRIEQRHISTFDLINDEAYRRGLIRTREYVDNLQGSVELKDRPVTLVYGTAR